MLESEKFNIEQAGRFPNLQLAQIWHPETILKMDYFRLNSFLSGFKRLFIGQILNQK